MANDFNIQEKENLLDSMTKEHKILGISREDKNFYFEHFGQNDYKHYVMCPFRTNKDGAGRSCQSYCAAIEVIKSAENGIKKYDVYCMHNGEDREIYIGTLKIKPKAPKKLRDPPESKTMQ